MRTQGLEVSGIMIQTKAREFNKLLNGPEKFSASNGWLWRFLDRHAVRTLTVCGEKQQADYKGSEEYVEFIAKLMKDENLKLDQLYNADEAGLIYRKSLAKTKALPDETLPPGRKLPKERITLLACANATGGDRLKLLTIGKSRNPRCFARINRQTLGCHYMHSKKAWMTADIFRDWFYNIFVPHVTNFLRSKSLPIKAVLLVDNASVHDRIALGDIRVEFLPPNTTSLIQPMDQGPIAALKKRYMTNFLLDIMNRDCHETAILKVKSWTIKNAVTLIATCWKQLSQDTLQNSWKNLLKKHSEEQDLMILENEMIDEDIGAIPNAEETEEDRALLDDLEAEMVSWSEINELTACYYVPTDQDIVHQLTTNVDCDLGQESSDEEPSGSHSEDLELTSIEDPETPEIVKISELDLVDRLEQLMDQLQLRSWSTAEDTQSTQAILMRAKKHIYHSKRKQKLLTDFTDN